MLENVDKPFPCLAKKGTKTQWSDMWCLGFCNQMLVVVDQEFYNCFIQWTCYLSFGVILATDL